MPRILIIEDERQVRDALGQMLTRVGYETDVAADGEEGLRCFLNHPADLVITDILMPGLDGLETIEVLRRDYPGLPIIAISGGGPGEKAKFALEMAQECGAVHILAKPFSRQEIMAVIKEALESTNSV
ncbi:MAG: response regulator [Magnetococcales bacterium]|nr:response regulator [Magnetococcales bacterium]MBF0437947.1 response regulator [Magnetococcales bacterium]